tara:strand:+ start:20874 stop:21194 length:321 start_codon:yes stop_codon:yes gene_type:complete
LNFLSKSTYTVIAIAFTAFVWFSQLSAGSSLMINLNKQPPGEYIVLKTNSTKCKKWIKLRKYSMLQQSDYLLVGPFSNHQSILIASSELAPCHIESIISKHQSEEH